MSEAIDRSRSPAEILTKPSRCLRWVRATAIVAVVLAAAVFWNHELDRRPIHADEAVNAVQASRYIDHGEYRYEPAAYHGPTLVLATRILLGLSLGSDGAARDLDILSFRRVTVAFGLLILVSFLLFVRRGGSFSLGAALAAMMFAAVSPSVGFYVRTFIHEPIFVVSILGALAALCWRLEGPSRAAISAVLLGLSGGVMIATKETWILVFAAGVIASGIVIASRGRVSPAGFRSGAKWMASAGVVAIVVAVSLGQIGQSTFTDVFRSFAPYFELGSTGGDHRKPIQYFAQQIIGWNTRSPVVVSEVPVVVWFLGGVWLVSTRRSSSPSRRSVVTVMLFALAMFGISSAIPYKTPWLALTFWLPAILVAGWSIAEFSTRLPRAVFVLLVAATIAPLAIASWNASIRFPSDPRNPFAYAQPSRDVTRLTNYLTQLAALPQPEFAPTIQPFVVHIVGEHPWPLPWTLRKLEHVGYWPTVSSYRAASPPIPAVYIRVQSTGERREAEFSPITSPNGEASWYHYGLRPGTVARVHVDPAWQARFAEQF